MSISTCALREEGDFHFAPDARPPKNLYPRPPRGGRPAAESLAALTDVFLSTPSARRATVFVSPESSPGRNFYPHPPRGGRQRGCGEPQGSNQFLSTPSARRATDVKATAYNKALISIHALREEGDVCWLYIRFVAKRFLSTPSARRATSTYRFDSGKVFNFYPRPPRGGRRAEAAKNRAWQISIHALREEGDSAHLAKSGLKLYFYPRPPRGGRHHRPYSQYLQQNISIHALREEGDR